MESVLDDLALACIMQTRDEIDEAYNAIGDNDKLREKLLRCKSLIFSVVAHYTVNDYKNRYTIEALKNRVEEMILERAKNND